MRTLFMKKYFYSHQWLTSDEINRVPDFLYFKKLFQSTLFKIYCLLTFFLFIGEINTWGQSQNITVSPFQVPAAVTSITVETWGGGGGGGFGRSNNGAAGGGGGGGAYTISTIAVTPGSSITFTVGAGGTGGTAAGVAATSGGTTTFNSAVPVVAIGGGAGTGMAVAGNGPGGSGGAGGTYSGGNGANGVQASGGGGGGGSAGISSIGNAGSGITGGSAVAGGGAGGNGANNTAGTAGTIPGGGGAGGHRNGNNRAGGAGANGQIIVSWTQPIFYSQGSVNPNTLTNWNTNPGGGGYSPSSFAADYQTFIVQTGHDMSTTGAWTVSGTGTFVQISSGASIIANNAVTISSLIVDNGGTYTHNMNGGTLPTATWGATSNCNVTGITNTAFTSIAANPNFGNFTWDCPTQTVAQALMANGIGCTINGSMTVSRTNTGSLVFNSGNGTPTHRIIGDLIVGNGVNTSTLDLKSGGTGEVNIELGGNLTVNTNGTLTRTDGGTASFYFGYTGATTASSVSWGGSGTYTNTNISYIIQNVPAGKVVTLSRAMTIPAGMSILFTNGTLDCGTNVISGTGTFNLSAGARLVTANTNGVNAAPAGTGSIQTTTRTLNAGANYTYNGSAAQIIGTGPTAANNLTIDNISGITLSGSLSISGAVNLTNGKLSLGSAAYNLTIANGATITTPGSFDNNHMIVCDGTGSFIKQSTTSAGLVRVYPIGTNGFYTPFEITSLAATVAGTGSVNVRAVAGTAPGPPAANATDLQKYWVITTPNLSAITASASFTYVDPNEVGTGGDQTSYVPNLYSGGTWSIATGASAGGVNPMTITGATALAGTWTGREGPKTYYSYQSGNWNAANTWTIDPSGTLSVSPAVPGALDRAVILNGRTVTLTASQTVLSTQINEGGFLDVGITTGHNLGDVRGQGRIRLATGTFPGNTSIASFVAADGGTVEYYNSAGFTFSQLTYNNLILNLNTTALIATLTGDMTVNGNLTITQGRFCINDATAAIRNLTVAGDVSVSSNGNMYLGAGNANHRFTIGGDFTIDGTVDFYELGAQDYAGTNYAGNAHADVVFNNATADQSLLCNGVSEFYRIEINKGFDQTYVLNIDASNTTNFLLYGRNNQTNYGTTPPINNTNALGLLAGTVRLGSNIIIYCLATGNDMCYLIDEDAQLWVDGATVTVKTANSGDDALIVYGKARFSNNCTFNCNIPNMGLITRESSEIEIESGTITLHNMRPSVAAGTHRGAFKMYGGTLTVSRWDESGFANQHASFSIPYQDNVFVMTGGTIDIQNPQGAGGTGQNFSFVFGMNPVNAQVTGGTIRISTSNRNAYFNSRIPLPNFEVYGTANTASVRNYTGVALAPQPLIVVNNLSLQNSAILNTNNTNGAPALVDLTVGGNFSLPVGTTYTSGNNTTTFNGSAGQTFTNAGTISAGGLYNLVISNSSNTSISTDLTVRNDLSINSNCFLQDMGRYINVGNNITNSGTHISQAAGAVLLNGGAAQSIGGSGDGIFGNLIINKAAGLASLTANQSLTGNLRLAAGLLDISTFNLVLGTGSNIYDNLTLNTSVFSGTKMIRVAGNMSDGGVSKAYNSNSAFVFPIGTGADYTPATIQFTSSPSTWGSVNIKPVSQFNPFVTSTNSLNYYWKVTQSGFSGIPANSVSHTYHYIDADLVGRGTEGNYIPGVYNPYAWVYINDISQVVDASNDIRFTGVSYVNGDFTAGEINAFQPVTVYYSCVPSGNWNNLATWSTTSNAGPANATVLPGPSNPVVIGNGTLNQTVTIPAGFNNVVVGGLQINTGSTLDITTTTGHNFGAIPDSKVSGTGLLRISSGAATATFPGGDFGNFLTAGGGTVEYYSTGVQDFTLPANKTFYNNLVLSPTNGRYIAMPDINLSVFGDYTISGTSTGVARLNSVAARTLIVEGDINITGGTLQYYNGFVQTVYANSDINISNTSSATFNVRNGGTAVTNLLYVDGNLNNDGTFDMYTSATLFGNVYFTGAEDKVISGTGTNDFNILNVNKGSSRNTILDVTANNLSLSYTGGAALVLSNGTFRVSNSLLNFTLSTATSFTIPTTAALSVNDGTVTIGTTNDAGDLILAGRLEVLNNGIVNIGTGGAYNNDIEYASGGTPEIIVLGGSLTVTGQVRRPINISTGALNYTQGGTSVVTILGRAANNARSMFEILNSGSSFNMSGGTLNISRNYNNVAYNELYLAPTTSSVTGGSIRLGSSSVTAGTAFNFVTSAPLWNLDIDATTTTKTANQRIYPLTVKNNLTIEGQSDFHANGFDVTVGGNFTNNNSNAGSGISTGGYQAGSLTQVTTFNGTGAQSIIGAGSNLTNFANLIIATGTSVTLAANTNLQINKDLTLTSGTLSDGGNNITVIGNIDNSAVHSSPAGTGGIILAGTQKQVISGSGLGIFGNLTLNNSLGIDMIDNSVINGKLTFSNGNIYIDDYLLTFGNSASIGGTPDANNMVLLNGVISDQGVKKLFDATTADFTFPIGVAGKYTPVRYNITANGAAGTILLRPINYKHPSTYENPAATNELQYYWNVVSTGFSGLSVDHVYNYSESDALPDETNYVVGKFDVPTYSWSAPVEGTVNAASDNFTLIAVNYLDGEYTCGVNIMPSPNFQNMPIYYSRNLTSGGNWTDPNAWTLNSDGSGGPAPSYPQGNTAIILTGHNITLNSDSRVAYAVEINGTLTVGTTLYHSLGHIRGGGTIHITSTTSGSFILPAGEYEDFMNNAASTINFYNNSATPATLPLKPGNNYKPFQNVIFSGNGVKYVSAENMRTLGNMTIAAGTGVLSDALHNKNITILGNWTDNNTVATGGFVPGTGRVIFNGTNPQSLTVVGGTTTEQFFHFEINNTAGLTLAGSGMVAVNRKLYLTLGNISTNATNLLRMTYTSPTAVTGGGSTSFVNGPLLKAISAGSYFNFPVGNANGTRFGNLYVSTVSAAGEYTAQYYNHNPGNDGYNPSSVVNPIDAVSDIEYWRLNGPAATANVRIRWDAQSVIIPADAASRSKLRIVEWNGSAWQNRGNTIADGGASSGTIQTNPAVSVTGDHRFTIGAESLPTATITSGNASICDDGASTNITIALTGTAPWTIHYKVNGANETTVSNIASSPHDLVVSNAIEPLATQGPGTYIFNVSYVQDATGSTGIRDFTTTATITLNVSPAPVISGNATAAINENNVIYSTPLVSGHTYLWSYSGPAGTTHNGVLTNNTLDMHWGTVAGAGWVQVTETAGSCVTSTAQYDVTITDTPNPLVTGPTPVCNNVTLTYRTARVGSHTYAWTLPLGGGSIVGATNRDSVVVQWTATGARSVSVAETGSSTISNTLNVTVNPLPAINNVVTDPSICNGQTASIIIQATAAGISYQLRLNSDDSNVGTPVSSGPGGDITVPASPVVTTIYNILATNEYTCSAELTDLSTVTVNDPPVASAGTDESICAGGTLDLSTSTTPPSASVYSSLLWSTSGDGTFNNTAILQPVYTPGTNDLSAGSVVLTLTANGNGACGSVNDAMSLVITAVPGINNPGNQTACNSYTLQTITGTNLTGNEAYYTGSGGTGTQYNATDVISSSISLYIYDETGTTPNCFDEESFTVTINISPNITDPGDQTVCDSYTLPVIAGTNLTGNEAYYTGSAGTGTQYNAGDVISSTTTLYIYDETGTTPNCTDEESFLITVNNSPAPSVTGSNDVCESESEIYSTPATGNNFAWTVTGGVINSGQGTNQITVTWNAIGAVQSAAGTVEVGETTPETCLTTDTMNITIHRVPVTGPEYHIRNTFTP
jgi:hypothetical protein